MSRFKVGDTVYRGRGEHMQEMAVARVVDNHLLPIYQYTFEAPNDGFVCGEQSIRATPDGPDLSMRDCWKDNCDSVIAARINTTAMVRGTIRTEEALGGKFFQKENCLFRPNFQFCDWVIEYANGRTIIDVGSGQGHLIRMLKRRGAKKVMGFEPLFDLTTYLTSGEIPENINEVMPWTIERGASLVNRLGKDNVLLVFARPEGSFVEEGLRGIDPGIESLYISEDSRFLGEFAEKATVLPHRGTSEDDELVYSIIR